MVSLLTLYDFSFWFDTIRVGLSIICFRVLIEYVTKYPLQYHGNQENGYRISEKGVHMYKGVGFDLLILSHFFLNSP